jgi:thiamine kinase-like enzyme
MDQCRQIVAALAGIHALWWDHPQLGTEIGSWPDGPLLGRELEDLAHRYAAFADMMGERLSRERRDLYERFLRSTPRLMERHARRRELTIVHGDAHAWNVFLPVAPARDGARIFDWDSWRIDIGAADLAYLMAMHWYPELRQRAEVRLLDTYHEELLREGVGGYSRDDLAADYRLAVLWHLAVPVHQASYGIPPVIWWNNLERILLAVADLGCSELLS